MLLGENPKKVVNLVTPVVPVYRDMYADVVASLSHIAKIKILTYVVFFTLKMK